MTLYMNKLGVMFDLQQQHNGSSILVLKDISEISLLSRYQL